MKMSRSTLLMLPAILLPLASTSCDKYKYDNPHQMLKNMSSSYITLAYPYEEKSDIATVYYTEDGYKFVYEEIRDIENVVTDGFKKIKSFKKVNSIETSSKNEIWFSFDHKISQNNTSNSCFHLYDDGNLCCTLSYYVSTKKIETKSLYFTFDSDIAAEIYTNAYAQFEKAKEDKETFADREMNFNAFFSTAKDNGGQVVYEKGSKWLYDDGRIGEELKKLSETINKDDEIAERPAVAENTSLISYELYDPNSEYKRWLTYHDWPYTMWRMTLSEDGSYVELYFNGVNTYDMNIDMRRFYRIDPTRGLETINNIKQIISEIKK